MTDKTLLPQHVGIIMDGNGRWAKKRGLPNNVGHKKGAEVFENISRHCRDMGIPWLTVYAFSTENWRRPKDEVSGIMNLMRSYLKNMVKAKNEHIAVRFISSRENIEPDLLALMEEAETADVGEDKSLCYQKYLAATHNADKSHRPHKCVPLFPLRVLYI